MTGVVQKSQISAHLEPQLTSNLRALWLCPCHLFLGPGLVGSSDDQSESCEDSSPGARHRPGCGGSSLLPGARTAGNCRPTDLVFWLKTEKRKGDGYSFQLEISGSLFSLSRHLRVNICGVTACHSFSLGKWPPSVLGHRLQVGQLCLRKARTGSAGTRLSCTWSPGQEWSPRP